MRVRPRSRVESLGWTARDYAKRVWDNAGEDNVLFLAGGIAFNILLAVVPFILLLVWFLTYLLNRSSADAIPAGPDAPDLMAIIGRAY